MGLIILLIVIFFLWRHFRRKKAVAAESQAGYQASRRNQMDHKKEENQSTIGEKMIGFIASLLAGLTGGYAGRYVYCLIAEGMYFAEAGLWNCIFLAVIGGVGFALGAFGALVNFARAKWNPIQWILLLLPTLGMLGGYAGIAFVVCAFGSVFGETMRGLGYIVSALGLLLLWKFALREILYCLLFGWLPFQLRPIPLSGPIAYRMFARVDATERKKYGRAASVYALKCARRASAFYEKKIKKPKPDAHVFYYYYDTIEFMALSYWEGTVVKREAAKAVSLAEHALNLSGRLRYVDAGDADGEEDEGLFSFDVREIPVLYFISFYEILEKAYGTGDGVKKDEKRAKEASTKLAALHIKKHLRELSENKKAGSRTLAKGVSETDGETLSETPSETPSVFDFPYLIMDDWNRQWILDWNNGDEARYTLDPNYDPKVDFTDSLSDGVVYLKKEAMRSGQATYGGRSFHW